jgi:FtsH-binding integral membrane protein
VKTKTYNTLFVDKTQVIIRNTTIVRKSYTLLGLAFSLGALISWITMTSVRIPYLFSIYHILAHWQGIHIFFLLCAVCAGVFFIKCLYRLICFITHSHAFRYSIFFEYYYDILLFLRKKSRVPLGILFIFMFMGLMGNTMGPILNRIFIDLFNGPKLVIISFCLISLTLLVLANSAIVIQNDFHYWIGFSFATLIILIFGNLLLTFIPMPTPYVINAGITALIVCGFLLFETRSVLNTDTENNASIICSILFIIPKVCLNICMVIFFLCL